MQVGPVMIGERLVVLSNITPIVPVTIPNAFANPITKKGPHQS